MASFNEDGVVVRVTLSKAPDGTPRVEVSATSLAGTIPLRNLSADITSELTSNQLQTVLNIVSSVEARAKARWEIP